jgi:hypothetical protein
MFQAELNAFTMRPITVPAARDEGTRGFSHNQKQTGRNQPIAPRLGMETPSEFSYLFRDFGEALG